LVKAMPSEESQNSDKKEEKGTPHE
jgi:hypothetical protein